MWGIDLKIFFAHKCPIFPALFVFLETSHFPWTLFPVSVQPMEEQLEWAGSCSKEADILFLPWQDSQCTRHSESLPWSYHGNNPEHGCMDTSLGNMEGQHYLWRCGWSHPFQASGGFGCFLCGKHSQCQEDEPRRGCCRRHSVEERVPSSPSHSQPRLSGQGLHERLRQDQQSETFREPFCNTWALFIT